MKALISPLEPLATGFRIAQVEDDFNVFPVAEPLFWMTCPNGCVAEGYFYNPETEQCEPIPVAE